VKLRTLSVLFSTVSIASVVSSTARGDDHKKVCTDAYAEAQTLRDAHKLKEARDQLRLCSQSTCTAFIVKDCTSWLLDIEDRVPSVVFSAKDGRGQPLTNVTVAMDGAPVAQKLDGKSIEVDPGMHAFTFVASDGTKVEQPFAVLEGQKAQSVAASVPSPTPPALAASPPPSGAVSALAPSAGPGADTRAGGGSSIKIIGLVVGGVGVAGLVVGSIFGVEALSTKGAHCPSDNLCAPEGSAGAAESQARNANIGFVAGGVLAAGGAALFLLTPSGPPEGHAAGASVRPFVGPSTGGLEVAGRW
jgi:hypothetical protein